MNPRKEPGPGTGGILWLVALAVMLGGVAVVGSAAAAPGSGSGLVTADSDDVELAEIEHPPTVDIDENGDLVVEYLLVNNDIFAATVDQVTLDVDGAGSDTDEAVEVPLLGSTEGTLVVDDIAENFAPGEVAEFVVDAGEAGTLSSEVAIEGTEGTAEFDVTDIETNAPVIEGEDVEVLATIENSGSVAGTADVETSLESIDETSATVDLDSSESVAVTLTLETAIEQAGEYSLTVATPDDAVQQVVELQLPSLPGFETQPQDITGDGEYEDVTGDGEFDIDDVVAFFQHYDSDAVQNHAWAYDFNDDGQVSVFDAIALQQKLLEQGGPGQGPGGPGQAPGGPGQAPGGPGQAPGGPGDGPGGPGDGPGGPGSP